MTKSVGALVVQLVKSGLITQRKLDRIPGQKENFQKGSSSPPICKMGTWSCTGEQSTLAVSHYRLMVLVGLQVPVPTPAV